VREIIADDDVRHTLRRMDADVQASLALHRATLQTLAALSPLLNSAADAALEEEGARAMERGAPQRMLEIVEETRLRLQRAPTEARITSALQRALIDAAEALPASHPARVARVA
jgi:hypothetical protein